MKISFVNPIINSNRAPFCKEKASEPNPNSAFKPFEHDGMTLKGAYNKAFVSFKGYYGDGEPSRKLFWILAGTNDLSENKYTNSHLYNDGNTGSKKWVKLPPEQLLKFEPKHSIEAIFSLSKPKNAALTIPTQISTPDYGNNWGRKANYIEINPRTIANIEGDKKTEGLLNLIKLLPAIPPSPTAFANCIILSQLYPSIHNDGKVGDSSLYTINLDAGISKNLTSDGLSRDGQKMGDDEMVRAFNDLSHARGLKTGIRLPLSEGQIRVKGKEFNWGKDENAFIDACCDAVDLGFDSIFFDSAKHVGNHEMEHYCGVGVVPNFEQMQYINQQIRQRTGRNDISIVGEKCTEDYRYKEMGLTAGNAWSDANNFECVLYDSEKQSFNQDYAAGPTVSDDNDEGQMFLDQRLNKIKNVLFGYNDVSKKLPSFMQMQDIFPLTQNTNTHKEMLESENYSAYGDTDSHYNNLFNTSATAKNHTESVYNEFLNVMYK